MSAQKDREMAGDKVWGSIWKLETRKKKLHTGLWIVYARRLGINPHEKTHELTSDHIARVTVGRTFRARY